MAAMTFIKYTEPTRGRERSRSGGSSGSGQTEQALLVGGRATWKATWEDVLGSAFPAGSRHTHDSEISLSYKGHEGEITRLAGPRLSLPAPIKFRALCEYTDRTWGYCRGTMKVSIVVGLQANYQEHSREYHVFDWGSR